MPRILCIAALVLIAACSEEHPTGPIQRGSPERSARDRGIVVGPPVRTLDDQLAELADSVPGFGGLFISAGEIHAFLSDLGQATHLRARLATSVLLSRHHEKPIRILMGRYGFRDLKIWNDRLVQLMASQPGVVSFDINEAENKLNVTVANPEITALVNDAVRMSGIPADAVRILHGELSGGPFGRPRHEWIEAIWRWNVANHGGAQYRRVDRIRRRLHGGIYGLERQWFSLDNRKLPLHTRSLV